MTSLAQVQSVLNWHKPKPVDSLTALLIKNLKDDGDFKSIADSAFDRFEIDEDGCFPWTACAAFIKDLVIDAIPETGNTLADEACLQGLYNIDWEKAAELIYEWHLGE